MRFHSPGVAHFTTDHIIGLSPQMLDLKETLLKIAPRNSNVLITGESGTGKELFARALHAASLRRAGVDRKIELTPDRQIKLTHLMIKSPSRGGGKRGG
ncbi:MAG: two-component system, NtrC family, response regulator AtoC, partial [Thermoanaerobacter sp.]|nr:two-component system, NtrC family, response regulator AtoC [Thermoanaerobacter sp.]